MHSSDIYLQLPCCWTIKRCPSHDGNKEKGKCTLGLWVWQRQGKLGHTTLMHGAHKLYHSCSPIMKWWWSTYSRLMIHLVQKKARKGMVENSLQCDSIESNLLQDIDTLFQLKFDWVWSCSNMKFKQVQTHSNLASHQEWQGLNHEQPKVLSCPQLTCSRWKGVLLGLKTQL